MSHVDCLRPVLELQECQYLGLIPKAKADMPLFLIGQGQTFSGLDSRAKICFVIRFFYF